MVNGPDQTYIEKKGKLVIAPIKFRDETHLFQIAQRIVNQVGRRVDQTTPLADARLKDGSRVNVIVPPLRCAAPRSPFVNSPRSRSRRYAEDSVVGQDAYRAQDRGRMPDEHRHLGRYRFGQDDHAQCPPKMIDPGERVLTIEDAAELACSSPICRWKRARPPGRPGRHHDRRPVKNALRMRPDRIILGEIRGAECFDLLAAMNTGHDGSMYAAREQPARMFRRMENMILMGDIKIPKEAISRQIAEFVDLIVQVKRLRDGPRTTNITEVIGMEGDVIVTQELFKFEYLDESEDGKIMGEYRSSGLRPYTLEKARQFGFDQAYLEACL